MVQNSNLRHFCDFCLSRDLTWSFSKTSGWMQGELIECQGCECERGIDARRPPFLRGEATPTRFAKDLNFTSPLQSSQILPTLQNNVVTVVPLLSHKAFNMIWAYTWAISFFRNLIASLMRINEQFFHPRFAFRFQRDGSNAWDSVRVADLA